MWLRRRLDTAERGRDQLDRKLRILLPELERRRLLAARRREVWIADVALAQTWLLRASLLGGQDALANARPQAPADVQVVWTTSMGLSYPDDVRLTGPDEPPILPAGNAAIAPAAAAFRAALLSGARTAAADEAVLRVEAEVLITRHRLRALEKRWLPHLQQALDALELSLEQAEQEDGMRLRQAAATPPEGISS
jgi:V/A-type H+-transporting ATPase subunit D